MQDERGFLPEPTAARALGELDFLFEIEVFSSH
jgi:hypothetical protein